MIDKKVYLAYGSNLNLNQMKKRCPKAVVLGQTYLKDYKLEFRGKGVGVATIVKSKGKVVPCLLWRITRPCEASLDIYEGYPHLYRKEEVLCEFKGKKLRAMAYVMIDGKKLYPPSEYYYNTIKQGYIDCGFDVKLLDEFVKDNNDENKHKIIEQVIKIRDIGQTNMFDTNAVQKIAYDMKFYELVCFIEDDKKSYCNLIMTGKY